MIIENNESFIAPKETIEELERVNNLFYVEALNIIDGNEFTDFNALMKYYIHLRKTRGDNFSVNSQDTDKITELVKSIFHFNTNDSVDIE